MWRDVAALWLRENWALVLAVLLLVQALLAYFWALAAVLTGFATLLSILVFVRDALTQRKEARNLLVEQRRDPSTAGLEPPSAWSDGQLRHVRDQAYLTSERADQMIRGGSLRLEFSPVAHRLPAVLSGVVPAVVASRRRSGSLVFNGAVLRLDSDPATVPSGNSTLTVRPTRYFDALTTNYLCGRQVVSQDHRRVVATGWEFAVDRRGFVRDLEQSWSANHIGISTLAFTTDLQVVLVQQSDGNVSERGRVAPSGSGSAEPRDCLQNIEPLTDVLGRAMERELREECNLDGVPMRTKVLGYSRWIDHGAMPEFYGVTALGVDERAMLDLKVFQVGAPTDWSHSNGRPRSSGPSKRCYV